MMKHFKMVAVAAGAVCLVATTAGAAEMRLPSSAPMTTAGSTIALPQLAQAPGAERIQLAQRRGGARRGAGRRFRGGGRGFRGNRGARRFRGGGRRGGRRGRRIGTGLAIGLGALAIGAIAAEAARSNRGRGGRCGRWLRACENGSRRSCRRFDRNC